MNCSHCRPKLKVQTQKRFYYFPPTTDYAPEGLPWPGGILTTPFDPARCLTREAEVHYPEHTPLRQAIKGSHDVHQEYQQRSLISV